MTTSTIAESVQAHIRDQVLFGDDRDLSSSTPLLQLGILDSFALIALVAHLNDSFGIDIRADELNGRNFRDIDSIARLMAERLLSASALEPARRLGAERQRTKGVFVLEGPSCAQLFSVFTDLARNDERLGGRISIRIARYGITIQSEAFSPFPLSAATGERLRLPRAVLNPQTAGTTWLLAEFLARFSCASSK